MSIPNGFYVIHQPKHRIPGVYDLHERGMFKGRPFVTKEWGYRIIANEALETKMQFMYLVEKNAADPKTGERYSFVLEKTLIDLDKHLIPDLASISDVIQNEAALKETMEAYNEWRNGFVPQKAENRIDQEELQKKLRNAINDRKEANRKELVRKNKPWIDSAIPGLIHGFHYDLYNRVEDQLFEEYKRLGGRDSESEMIRKAMLFYRIYLNDSQDLMLKANGDRWKDDDEIWGCWTGFAGSEKEAKRICQTLNAGFRPLAGETTIH